MTDSERFMTDEAKWYDRIGEEFASHDAVNHAQNEYARDGQGYRIHTNSAENYFSVLKRGIYGTYPSLTDLDSGDLKYTTDFRRVYATLLDKWLNADSSSVLGNRFESVNFL